jgi:hypothetical protein
MFIALLIYGAVIITIAYFKRELVNKLWLFIAFLIVLPMQPLAFYLVRMPVNNFLVAKLGAASWLYQFISLWYAPLTEEPAKLVPLILPFIFRDIKQENFGLYALTIGLGFGIGEMWFIANRIAGNPRFDSLPFYAFLSGFGVERFMVCLFHGAFVSLSLWRLRNKFWFGFLLALLAHFFGNFPIFLASKNLFGLGQQAWQLIVLLWLQIYFIGAIVLLVIFNVMKKDGKDSAKTN